MTIIHHETSSESWVKFMAIIANHFILLINFKAYLNMLTLTLSNNIDLHQKLTLGLGCSICWCS